MRIAVTYEDANIFEHFGHTKQLKIYEIEEKDIVNEKILDVNENGHGAIAGLLASNGVEVLICGGIGNGAKKALEDLNIKLYGGVSGNADEAVKSFINGTLKYNENVHCEHHEADHHSCGEHKCTEDKHGCTGNH